MTQNHSQNERERRPLGHRCRFPLKPLRHHTWDRLSSGCIPLRMGDAGVRSRLSTVLSITV